MSISSEPHRSIVCLLRRAVACVSVLSAQFLFPNFDDEHPGNEEAKWSRREAQCLKVNRAGNPELSLVLSFSLTPTRHLLPLLASSCAVVVICELTAAVVGFSARTLAPFVYFFARSSFVRTCQVIFSRIPRETSRDLGIFLSLLCDSECLKLFLLLVMMSTNCVVYVLKASRRRIVFS